MWVRALALAVLASLLAPPAFVVSGALGAAFVTVAAVASLWSVYVGMKPRFRRSRGYDLGELRRVHEEAERRALEPDEAITVPTSVVCSRCLAEYDARLRACPRCGAGG